MKHVELPTPAGEPFLLPIPTPPPLSREERIQVTAELIELYEERNDLLDREGRHPHLHPRSELDRHRQLRLVEKHILVLEQELEG